MLFQEVLDLSQDFLQYLVTGLLPFTSVNSF